MSLPQETIFIKNHQVKLGTIKILPLVRKLTQNSSTEEKPVQPLTQSIENTNLCVYWSNVINADINLIDEQENWHWLVKT